MPDHYHDLVEEVLTLHEDSLTWTVKEIFLEVATSLDDDSQQEINLCETIGHRARQSRTFDPANVHWLQSAFNVNTLDFRSKTLLPFFQKACSAGGFKICSKGWEEKKGFLRIACTRHRHYKEDLRLSKHVSKEATKAPHLNVPHQKRSQHPQKKNEGLEGCKCPFGFTVFWNSHHQRWYLPKQQAGSLDHIGHPHLYQDEIRHGVNVIGEDNMELTQQAFSSEIRPGQTQNLIEERTGTTLEAWQVKHQFKKKHDSDLIVNCALDSPLNPSQMTAADKLLADLESNPNESYYALFARFETDLLKIVAKRKRERGQLPLADDDEEIMIDVDSLQDAADSASDYANRVRRSLSITGSGQILLGIAWTNNEARRKFEMFPELSACDVTMGTNAEERPLILFMGKDSLNLAFVHTYAFLPSQSRWIFDWFFESAAPGLHSTDACEGVQVNITDQDGQLMSGFLANTAEGKAFPNAVLRNCSFHKVYRNFCQDTLWKRLFPAEDDVCGQAEVGLITNWLNAFCKDYGTEQEADISWRLLNEYLDEDEDKHDGALGDTLHDKFKEDYLTKSFHPQRDSLFAHNFKDKQCQDESTSNLVEGTNSGMKRSEEGPRPKDSINRSKTKMTRMQDKKMAKALRQVAFDHTSAPAKDSDQERSVPKLTLHANDLVWKQNDLSKNMLRHRSGEAKFLVKHRREEDELEKEHPNMTKKERIHCRCRRYIPRFEKTHIVKLVQESSSEMVQQLVLQCSCNLWWTHGHCCRHIYAILQRDPVETDAKIRWWNIFYHAYGRPGREEISRKLHHIRKHGTPSGVPLTPEDCQKILDWPSDSETIPPFFSSTLASPRLRHPSYWTLRQRQDAQGNVPEHTNVSSNVHGLEWNGQSVARRAGLIEEVTQSEQVLPSQLEEEELQSGEQEEPPLTLFCEEDCNDQDDDENNSWVPVDGDNDVDDNGNEDGDDNGNVDEHRGVAGRSELKLSRSTIMNSYNEFMPLYQDVTRMVRSQEAFNFVRDSMHKMHEGVMAMQAASSSGAAGASSMGNTHSLPQVDRRKRDKRKHKLLSPAGKKRQCRT